MLNVNEVLQIFSSPKKKNICNINELNHRYLGRIWNYSEKTILNVGVQNPLFFVFLKKRLFRSIRNLDRFLRHQIELETQFYQFGWCSIFFILLFDLTFSMTAEFGFRFINTMNFVKILVKLIIYPHQ